MIDRKKAWAALARHITDEIVVATYSSATDWLAVVDRPLNYFAFGAMGLASSHALGLALARPDKRVIVLDGDGSLLMNLGTLVTIGAVAPQNFTHIVAHNGSYEANGGHPIPNRQTDFAGIARSSGIAQARRIDQLADFENAVPSLLKDRGPLFIDLIVEQGELGPRSYKDMYAKARRQAFREALKA